MATSLYRQYIAQARRLARLDPRRPQQANLRRAVSTTYYALFHFLVEESSRFLAGTAGERETLRMLVARAYGHGEIVAAARSFQAVSLPTGVTRIVGRVSIPVEIVRLAGLFADLQDLRHLADYDLAIRFARNEVLGLINDVEECIRDWSNVRNTQAARLFLICLLLWERVRKR